MKDAVLQRIIRRSLSGKGAHVDVPVVFQGLDWKKAGARPPGAEHSAYQTLGHMSFWQDWAVQWLDGEDPAIPRHAAGSWPGGQAPVSATEWKRAVARFTQGLHALERRAPQALEATESGAKTRLEMLHTIASHNSYHAGQVVVLRQMLACWPPPSGGLTW